MQGILGKNEPPSLRFTPGTPQKTEMAILAVFGLSLRIPNFHTHRSGVQTIRF